MAVPKLHVAVVGAGVIGLSVATHLLETFSDHLDVTIIADKFSPNTFASDRSGGLIMPPDPEYVLPGNTGRLSKWVKGTLKRLNGLYNTENGGKIGLTLLQGYFIAPSKVKFEDLQDLWWKDFVIGFRHAEQSEIMISDYEERGVVSFATYILSCPTYLPWLLEKFTQLGGVSEKQKIHNLSELASYDVVINCTGLGARELVNDQKMYPMQGHIVSVKAPWVKQFIDVIGYEPRRVYIMPRNEEVILGGTSEFYKEDRTIDPVEVQGILDRCQQIMPSLKNAEIKDTWVGVRPMREGGVRLEKENRGEGGSPIIIHCYGHGSYGVTLSWGCAEEVGSLIKECIDDKIKLKSKL